MQPGGPRAPHHAAARRVDAAHRARVRRRQHARAGRAGRSLVLQHQVSKQLARQLRAPRLRAVRGVQRAQPAVHVAAHHQLCRIVRVAPAAIAPAAIAPAAISSAVAAISPSVASWRASRRPRQPHDAGRAEDGRRPAAAPNALQRRRPCGAGRAGGGLGLRRGLCGAAFKRRQLHGVDRSI